jgi:hypothetical protein
VVSASVFVPSTEHDLDIMLAKVSGVSDVYISIRDANNPGNLPTHTPGTYNWTSQDSDSDVIISHTEYVSVSGAMSSHVAVANVACTVVAAMCCSAARSSSRRRTTSSACTAAHRQST